MQSGDRGMVWAGWSVLVASAAIVVIVPLIMLIRTSWVEGRVRVAELLTEPGFGIAVAHSFELSAAATALAVPIGVAIALGQRCCFPCSFLTSSSATAGFGPTHAVA